MEFLPELVNRAKKLGRLKKERKQKSLSVVKVYQSKMKQIKQMKKQIKSLEEWCDGLKQMTKSAEIKVGSMTSTLVLNVERSDKLNQKCQEIDQQLVKLIEEFEDDMKKVDQNFTTAFDTYKTDIRRQLFSKICEQIAAEEAAIDQIHGWQQNKNINGDDLERMARSLEKIIDLIKKEIIWQEANSKNAELNKRNAELEKTITELEAAI